MQPNKVNGLTEAERVRRCTGKRRWSDQLAATAGAIHALEQFPNQPPLYTYRCPYCAGWHLTKRRQPDQEGVTLPRYQPGEEQ